MTITPLDLEEWAVGLRVAGDAALVEFALDILDLIDRDWMVEAYLEILDRLDKLHDEDIPKDTPDDEKHGKHLDAVEAKLAAFEQADDDRRKKRQERAKKINAAKMTPPPLEYDL